MRNLYESMSSEEIMRRVIEMDRPGSSTHYDPIFTPLFVSLGMGASIGIGNATIASVASAIATTPLTKGVNVK